MLSIGAHALAAVIVFALPGKKASSTEDEPVVVFQMPPKPAALLGSPGPAAPQPAQAQPKPHRPKRPQVPLLTNEPPKTDPAESEPTEEPDPVPSGGGATAPGGTGNGGDPNGDPNGVIGGEVGGKGPPPPPTEPQQPTHTTLSWLSEMGRPVLVAGPAQPPYPNDARSQRIEGTVIAQCTITTTGRLQDCRILKGNPFLDGAVNATLAQQRYSPLMYGGKPVSVRYNITFKFKLQ